MYLVSNKLKNFTFTKKNLFILGLLTLLFITILIVVLKPGTQPGIQPSSATITNQLIIDANSSLAIAEREGRRFVVIIDKNNIEPQYLTDDTQNVLTIAQSKNKELIAFTSAEVDQEKPGTGKVSIWTMDKEGNNKKEIPLDINESINIAISPNQEKIAYTTPSTLNVITIVSNGLKEITKFKQTPPPGSADENIATANAYSPKPYWINDTEISLLLKEDGKDVSKKFSIE